LEAIMTMLSNPVAEAPLSRRRPGRALALLIMLMEVFAEAQEMARAAHQRHPFAEW
jgi:hypothetical protein